MQLIRVLARVFERTEVALIVCLVFRVRELLNIWLELLQQDQAKCNKRFRVDILQILSIFDLVDV